ncbi:MAG TPA: hypothetical protein VII73_09380 [Caulobacteraceae bacterium]
MTLIARRGAFDTPFQVRVVDGEILVESDQAPIEFVLTVEAARLTADRLMTAVRAAESPSPLE